MGDSGDAMVGDARREPDTGGPRRRAPAAEALDTRPRALTVGEIAWIALLPCAIVAVLAIVVLGPPVGHLLFRPGSDQLWPPEWWEAAGRAEPVKQGRYVVAVLVPALLVAAVLAGGRRELHLRPAIARAAVHAGSLLAAALVAAALIAQHPLLEPESFAPPVFALGSVLGAAAVVLAGIGALRVRSVPARLTALARSTVTRRRAAFAVAVGFTAIWLLKAVTTDRIGLARIGLNLPWTLNDAVAVLDGRTPLVDYHPIYAKLLPYPTALVLGAFGPTTLAYSTFMAVLDGLALLAVFDVFRRVTRGPLLALALFLPFVAVSDINAGLSGSPMTMSSMWPMRYGGIYLLVWLTARHIDGRGPRREWLLFLAGGLIAINDLEFGGGAVLASVVALLCARPSWTARELIRLAARVAAGALAAAALVAAITLARSGRMPDPGLLLEWPRIFTTLGWFSLPLRTWDLHIAIYATFAASIVVAAVRWTRRDDDALLTAMLAWSGVFGLLSGGYFIARPDVTKAIGSLSAWSFALSMLTVVCVRALAARGWRRPTLAELLVLFGFGLSICALARTSPPTAQIARLAHGGPRRTYETRVERFVRAHTDRGETVAILVPLSYRIAYKLGLRNVAPYAFMNAIVTRSQMRTLIDTLRSDHVREVFMPAPGKMVLAEGESAVPQVQMLLEIGYALGSSSPQGLIELRRA